MKFNKINYEYGALPTKPEYCYGCAACLNVCKFDAINMKTDTKGFSYPSIDFEKCNDCKKCYLVCPSNNKSIASLLSSKPLSVLSVRIKDDSIRGISSSGGLFTAISDYILSKGGVVYGAVWRDALSVVHIRTDTKDGRNKMRQSKYIQSEIGLCFRDIKTDLKNGGMVLFTGTPCQVAGLRLFLGDSNTDNLVLCDLLCGGNTSPGLFKDYITFIENQMKDKAVSVCFRTKKLGWHKYHMRVDMTTKVYEGARKDGEPFFSLFLTKYSLRESCFSSKFASVKRISDITMGDFWGVDKIDPDIDDDKGISLAIINTSKGATIISAIKDKIYFEERNIEAAIPRQRNLRNAPVPPPNREAFWNDYFTRGADYVLKKYTTFGLRMRLKRTIGKFAYAIGLLPMLKKAKITLIKK